LRDLFRKNRARPDHTATERAAPQKHRVLSERDLDALRDLAISLEEAAPFEAYALFRLALKHRPTGPVLRKKVADFERRTMKNTVVAWRNDGLCERINSIVLGRFAALALDLDFKFFWPDLSYLQDRFQIEYGKGHSVPREASEILAEQFMSAHQIQEADLLIPQGGLKDENPAIRPFILNNFDQIEAEQDIPRPCWLAPWRSFPKLVHAHKPEEYKAFFRDALFNENIKDQFSAIETLNLPDKRVAIHVRGGDVIYDAARHTHTFGRQKTVSLAIAEALCDHFTGQGYTVILFGASKADLSFLARAYANVQTVDELGLGDVDLSSEVLRDVWLMAGCEQIVSAEDTGVTKLAVLVGRAGLLPYTRLFPPAAEYAASQKCVSSKRVLDYPVLQQAFIHYSLFMTAPATVDIPTLFEHIREAHSCDPENVQYMALCLLSALALERRDTVEAFEDKLSRALCAPIATCFANPEARRRYLPLGQHPVQRLLSAIALATGRPDYIDNLL